jgi:hypothetical protein
MENHNVLVVNSRILNDFPRSAEVRYLQAARSRMPEAGVLQSRADGQQLPYELSHPEDGFGIR